jgi:uncharacterized protein
VVTRDTAWPEGTPCWVDLEVSDITMADMFYAAQFGWDIRTHGPEAGGYSIAHLQGRGVAGIGPKMGPPETPPAWTMYLATDDADTTAARITSAGGRLLLPPGDVADAGRMALAADITGGVFGVWQAGAHIGTEVANMPGALTWNEHMSHDFEGAKAFYAAVFGYEFGDMSTEEFSYATLLLGGHEVGGIGGYPEDVAPEVPAAWSTYFGTSDTDDAVARATAHGGFVIRPPNGTPYGRTATVADDQGAVFSLISMPPGE